MAKIKGKAPEPETNKPRVQKKDEAEKVQEWRQEQLVKVLRESGLADDDIDVNSVQILGGRADSHHHLKDLIDKGCDPKTALEIVK